MLKNQDIILSKVHVNVIKTSTTYLGRFHSIQIQWHALIGRIAAFIRRTAAELGTSWTSAAAQIQYGPTGDRWQFVSNVIDLEFG